MTDEPKTFGVDLEGGQEPLGGDAYSKDYWDLVFEQLSRRFLFKFGMAVLALMYAVAIYAPLVANDRPYVIDAINYKEYGNAARTLSAVASSVTRLLEQGDADYLEQRGENAPPTWAAALELERQAALERVATMRAYLPPVDHEPLDVMVAKLDQATTAALAGSAAEAEAFGQEAKELARSLRREYKAADPEKPEDGGKVLVPQRSYPLFATISWGEVFFMVLWAFVLTWPLWNRLINRLLLQGDRDRIRIARKRKLVGVLGISALASVLWVFTVGGSRSTFDVGPYKSGLTSGELVSVSEPVFPPIAAGYAETHTEENFRPPTWSRAAEVDEKGYYVHGSRRPKADPVTGYLPEPTPVEVRAGEHDVNSGWRHPMGTDELGRDFLVRLIWGSRVSLAVGILSAVLLTVIGVFIGSLAGFFGGWVDIVIMRTIEILQSIPALFLILLVMAFTDPEVIPPIFAIVFVIALVRWTGVARLVRGEFLRLREQEFVMAAHALGFSSLRTMFRHVLPNALSPVLVNAAFAVASGILTESVISYLGFGIQHPGASWGSLVNESKSPDHWWIQVFPGVLIFVTVTCYNLVGDAVRDALDPKMKV